MAWCEAVAAARVPVVAACTGHAVALGAGLLLAADLRVGASGPYKVGFNEVTIGLPLPATLVRLACTRLDPARRAEAVLLGRLWGPERAIEVGFLDEVHEPAVVVDHALARATELAETLDLDAYRATKAALHADVG
jgi:enoyl-CoA hydratase